MLIDKTTLNDLKRSLLKWEAEVSMEPATGLISAGEGIEMTINGIHVETFTTYTAACEFVLFLLND